MVNTKKVERQFPAARMENEAWEAYKKRQRDEHRRLKAHLRGTKIWTPDRGALVK